MKSTPIYEELSTVVEVSHEFIGVWERAREKIFTEGREKSSLALHGR